MAATRILALDLATIGAAAWTAGELGGIGTLHFDLLARAGLTVKKRAAGHGAIFAQLHTLVLDLIDLAQPEVVAIEKDTGRGYATLVMLGGLRGVAELACAQRGVRCITDIDASTARSLAGVGGGSTSKAVAGGRARMLFGLTTQTDDEVDAVVLHHAVRARLLDEHRQALVKASLAKVKRTPSTRRRAA